jgi:AcrR family transcriptional regulator
MSIAAEHDLGPWERRRIHTSLEIECAALAQIVEHGLDSVTVEQIADAAGISTRTFFRYFKNVRDVLTAVTFRETERLCVLVRARPKDEPLLDAFRAVYKDFAAIDLGIQDTDQDDAELKSTSLAYWGRIVQRDPEAGRSLGHVTEVMTEGFSSVIRERLDLPTEDFITAGVLAAALAGAVWFTYVHWLQLGTTDSLGTYLDSAFDCLAGLG